MVSSLEQDFLYFFLHFLYFVFVFCFFVFSVHETLTVNSRK